MFLEDQLLEISKDSSLSQRDMYEKLLMCAYNYTHAAIGKDLTDVVIIAMYKRTNNVWISTSKKVSIMHEGDFIEFLHAAEMSAIADVISK